MVDMRKGIFMGLNAVRVLSIVGLLLVFSSSIFVMVNDIRAVNSFMHAQGSTDEDLQEDCDYIDNSTVPNQAAGVFWAVLNRLLIIFQVIVLLFSECSWPMAFFDRFFPVLGPNFGLGALGIFESLISTTILSHHVDDFTLVAAFFLFAVGCINMLLGLIFRASAKERRSIRAFRAAARGVLPAHADVRPPFARAEPSLVASFFTGSTAADEKAGYAASLPRADRVGLGFGRQGEKAAGLRGFLISKPVESLPRYAPRPVSVASESRYSSRTASPVPERAETPRPAFHSSQHAL